MPRGQKNCPKCSKPAGPRTKVCECGYVYLHDSVDKVVDGIEVSAKVGKKKCSNCSKEMESCRFNVDPYGKITYFYEWDSYCSTSCLEAASERKDDLISEFLNKIHGLNEEEFDNIEELINNLSSFINQKRIEDDYQSLIEDIERRALIEREEDEYRKTHPYIVHVTNPTKRFVTPEECREVGLAVPPKIGEHVSAPIEEDINPLKNLLNGKLTIGDIIGDDEENEENESEEKEETSLSSLDKLLKTSPSVNPLADILGSSKTDNSSSGIVFDATSRPRQGQKKCRGRCGMIVGVRTKVCPKCGFQF